MVLHGQPKSSLKTQLHLSMILCSSFKLLDILDINLIHHSSLPVNSNCSIAIHSFNHKQPMT